MQLPFLIRGTKEWDNREYMRYLMGCKVMSFGPLTLELEADKRYIHVRRRIRDHLERRGVPTAEIEAYINDHRPKIR